MKRYQTSAIVYALLTISLAIQGHDLGCMLMGLLAVSSACISELRRTEER